MKNRERLMRDRRGTLRLMRDGRHPQFLYFSGYTAKTNHHFTSMPHQQGQFDFINDIQKIKESKSINNTTRKPKKRKKERKNENKGKRNKENPDANSPEKGHRHEGEKGRKGGQEEDRME